jgi:hypothetical protein
VLPESSEGLLNKVLVLILALVAFACSSQKAPNRPEGSLVGVLCVTGNEPFTSLSLQTSDGAMHGIQKDTTDIYRALQNLQGHKVRLRIRLQSTATDTSALIVEEYELAEDH